MGRTSSLVRLVLVGGLHGRGRVTLVKSISPKFCQINLSHIIQVIYSVDKYTNVRCQNETNTHQKLQL